jgi:putative transposase
MILNPESHNPLPLHLDDRTYWISASTLGHARILDDPAKTIWRDTLKELASRDGARLYAWVVLEDHYHLLLWLRFGEDLPAFIHGLHGRSSRSINKEHGITGRRVWYQYWDRCIRDERDFFTRLNYLYHNPVKHGYVKTPEDYPFSSYLYFQKKYGMEWLRDLWERYPVVDFTPEEGDSSSE